jgi:hypothetical protein
MTSKSKTKDSALSKLRKELQRLQFHMTEAQRAEFLQNARSTASQRALNKISRAGVSMKEFRSACEDIFKPNQP